MTVEQLKGIQRQFQDAAVRAKKAGADGIEYQMCHNYLGAQLLSPLFNHRTDEYGIDTLENHFLFLNGDAVSPGGAESAMSMILAVKPQGFDGQEWRPPRNCAASFAPYIEKSRCRYDYSGRALAEAWTGVNVSSGDGVSRVEGWKVAAPSQVKEQVSIPVCATGNIRHPQYVDKITGDEKCDMVGMGRGIFAEREWVKCAEGERG